MATKPKRWSHKELCEFVGGKDITQLAFRLGVKTGTVHRWKNEDRHFTDVRADQHAGRIGCHPSEIWTDWFD